MATRSRALLERHSLGRRSEFHWNLTTGEMIIGEVRFGLVTAGTVAGDSFLWSWANEAVPPAGKRGIDKVRQLGIDHDLPLLKQRCATGGLAQAKECLAIAGAVLEGSGIWVDETDAGWILFVLHEPSRTR